MASLPTYGQGGYFNAPGPGASGLLGSSNDIVSWLQGIIPTIFPDPICGDGSCDADELQGLGRFGWLDFSFYRYSFVSVSAESIDCFQFASAKDCGRVPMNERLKVDVQVQSPVHRTSLCIAPVSLAPISGSI